MPGATLDVWRTTFETGVSLRKVLRPRFAFVEAMWCLSEAMREDIAKLRTLTGSDCFARSTLRNKPHGLPQLRMKSDY